MTENQPKRSGTRGFGFDFDKITDKFDASFAELKDVLNQMLGVLQEINNKTADGTVEPAPVEPVDEGTVNP